MASRPAGGAPRAASQASAAGAELDLLPASTRSHDGLVELAQRLVGGAPVAGVVLVPQRGGLGHSVRFAEPGLTGAGLVAGEELVRVSAPGDGPSE